MTDREFYNIICTIHLSFKNLKKVSLVKHPESKIISIIRDLSPELKSLTKDTFSIWCLYTQFKFLPSSINSLAKKMGEVSKAEIYSFRDSITNYKSYLNQDIEYLKIKYITPNPSELISEFKAGKIRFYTLYFSLKKSNIDLSTSRINSILWESLQGLMLFVIFKEESINNIMKNLNSIFGEI